MDIESHESDMLLKESSPRKRQGLAVKLAVVLCGLGLLVNLIAPIGTLERALGSSSTFKEEKVTAAATAGVSPTFSEIYGRLAALQASGAAPIIKAWLAGELPLTSFP